MLREKQYRIKKQVLGRGSSFPVFPSAFCHIFYQLSGHMLYRLGGYSFTCKKDELVVMNCGLEAEICSCPQGEEAEFYELRLLPGYVRELSDQSADLEDCFRSGGEQSHIIAGIEVTMMVKNLMKHLEKQEENGDYGIELFERASLLMLLVQVNRGYLETTNQQKTMKRRRWMLDDIFSFIEENMDREILLDEIAAHFYVSKYHIAREFKRQTGVTLHSYIVKRKLSYCKILIERGLPIIEVYKRGGFGEYSHFFRAFRKEFDMTPKQYYRLKKREGEGKNSS